jgi:hypothetical protein
MHPTLKYVIVLVIFLFYSIKTTAVVVSLFYSYLQ